MTTLLGERFTILKSMHLSLSEAIFIKTVFLMIKKHYSDISNNPRIGERFDIKYFSSFFVRVGGFHIDGYFVVACSSSLTLLVPREGYAS